MHSAPLVKYPVGRFSWGWWFLWAMGGLIVWFTASLYLDDQLRPSSAFLSWACVVLAIGLGRSAFPPRAAPAWLMWDGQGWQWWPQEDGEGAWPLGTCAVQLDFQRVLLLHFPRSDSAQGTSAARWVWLYKGFAPAQWHGLRCAVYSRLNP